ncbi:MAG: DUF1326 domain-containing protein [SAR324 cluster bacterium]|nr:DUF1326 domain-containing protein [SAR324 cluster bacterium]MCZ6532933.1 DUF1326 domain-containing protein [SAR324 cluster bacterium]MCZ6626828.1 DUF1326 domain-containing protein [SAR324 cluster bacterium]MCZ6728640.1 DUF1326 domain-containing protein [SAR324 cluster bacterium]MCZ6843423.1 DUF1326 domain-containing protein [SAR324 cluster bacterium]
MASSANWWAKGVFFENCNCQLLCRAHISFKQSCDFERCIGHWAFHFRQAAREDTRLDRLNAFIVCDAPQIMYEGNWTQAIYIDEKANEPQREFLEDIFTGRGGSTWGILADLIGTRLDTKYVPIHFEDDGKRKAMRIEGVGETYVQAIRGAERDQEVQAFNMFNQIHGDPQVLALGSTRFEDQGIVLNTSDTHAIYSEFSWRGP